MDRQASLRKRFHRQGNREKSG
uniref:Uncharacterized protein n=1 Tax=Rhizophora mucronata TaxID=61149 RepID=A0A2P2PV42_RHIMU